MKGRAQLRPKGRLATAFNLMRMYRRTYGRYPNLLFPRTYSEKMQVAKLTWRSPLLPIFVDKIRAKEFIAEHFGADLVTPNLYVGARLPPREERDWPVPFVIKPSHWSGGNIFVRTDAERDWDRIEAALEPMLGMRYGAGLGEWAYTQVEPRVLVEPFLGGADIPPTDFKLHTFGGRVAAFSLTEGRLSQVHYAVYDRNWKRLPVLMMKGPAMPPRQPPTQLDRMVVIAEEIGKRMPFCRVDFYEIDGKARFGEITIYSGSGLAPFHPPEYDRIFGDLFPKGRPADSWDAPTPFRQTPRA